MAGSTPSFAHVPLGEVLPHDYMSAERDMRGLASELDNHPSAADRSTWHWYPGRREPSQPSPGGIRLLLVDLAITLYDTREDWLELALDIAWVAPHRLTVNAAVEVACWCPHNHNMHRVRTAQWQAVNSRELVEAFAAGTAMLTGVLAAGPFDPHPWRVQAGLPDGPPASRERRPIN
jgi:hypothetical protein